MEITQNVKDDIDQPSKEMAQKTVFDPKWPKFNTSYIY